MKKILLILIICSSLFNCQKNDSELKEAFLGTWNNFPLDRSNEVQFYKDSVVLWNLCRRSSATWNLDDKKIYFKYIKTPPDTSEDHWSLNYTLNSSQDSLVLVHDNDSLEIVLLKIKNDWKHYLKAYHLRIDIPEAGPLASLQEIEAYNFPVLYIGWENSNIKVKGGAKTKTLTTSQDYIVSLFQDYSETNFDTIHPITLVVDKSISEKNLDSIKKIIKDLNLENTHFFRVYTHKNIETNYGRINPNCIESNHGWNWYGQWDD